MIVKIMRSMQEKDLVTVNTFIKVKIMEQINMDFNIEDNI